MKNIRCKKRKNKLKFFIIFIIADLVLGYLYFSATKLVLEAGGQSFQTNISNCSYYAIEKCIQEDFAFSKVCDVQKDVNGNIVFIGTDTLLLNHIVKQLSLDCYEYLDKVIKNGVDLPLGTFSGIRLLSGVGPTVNTKLNTALSVECRILRTFSSAGINQTRQTLSANIYAEIYIFAPFYKQKYEGAIEIVLFDNLIVGKVPNTYFDATVLASGKVNENN